jgi:hypothetical protein
MAQRARDGVPDPGERLDGAAVEAGMTRFPFVISLSGLRHFVAGRREPTREPRETVRAAPLTPHEGGSTPPPGDDVDNEDLDEQPARFDPYTAGPFGRPDRRRHR